jgi:hypothetical protein
MTNLDRSHPLYDVLHPCRAFLLYPETHALAEGRYAEVAERLQAAARRQRHYDWFLYGGLLVLLLARLGVGLTAGGTDNFVWACILAVVLAFATVLSRRRMRALARAISRLQQAAG